MRRRFFPAVALFLSFSTYAFSEDQKHDEHHPEEGSAPQGEAAKPLATDQKQMMGENCPMMKDPQMGAMHDLMHSGKIEVNVAEFDGGIIVKWSSTDKETAKKLKAMGQNIKKMHPMMKGQPDMMRDSSMNKK
jgi:hypothetical protein